MPHSSFTGDVTCTVTNGPANGFAVAVVTAEPVGEMSTDVPPTAPAKVTVLPIPVTLTFASAVFASLPNEAVKAIPVTSILGFAKSPQSPEPQVRPPQPMFISFVTETDANDVAI